jgi:uncharacterized protein (TIGR03437 family)
MIVAIPSAGPSGPFPGLPVKDLSTVRLEMQPRGTTQRFAASVVAADAVMIWAVVPGNAPRGWMDVFLTVNSSQATGKVFIDRSSFGLFSAISDGSGPAVAQNIVEGAGPVLNQLTHPVLPGQYITLWGTGLGDFTTSDVSIEFYGAVIQPTFAGHAPGQPGLDQINFRIPANAPAGCYVPVTVTVAGSDVSNQVTLATAASPGTPCTHPFGLSPEQLKTLDQGGTVVLGSLETGNSAYVSSSAPLAFARQESVGLKLLVANSQRAFTAPLPLPSASPACSLFVPPSAIAFRSGPIPGALVYSDAGPSISLSGPGQRNLTVPSDGAGAYSNFIKPLPNAPSLAALPPPVTAGGSWTVSAPGGDGVAAFQQAFILPAPLNWTNRDALATIDRNADLAITWDIPADVAAELVTVQLATSLPNGTPLHAGLSAGVSCTIAAQAGKLVITRDWLQKIVATLPGFSSQIQVSSNASPPAQLSVPLKAGGTAPLWVTRYTSESIPIVIR